MKRAAPWFPLVAIAFLAVLGLRVQFERWIVREAARRAVDETIDRAEQGIAAIPTNVTTWKNWRTK